LRNFWRKENECSLASLPGRVAHEIGRAGDRIKGLSLRADTALATRIARERSTLAAHDRVLLSLSYKNVLKRGYAVIRDEKDAIVSSATAILEGQPLSIEFADGRMTATAGEGGSTATRPRKSEKPAPAKKPEQGSLF
ncbi:MAG TPA: exodeoxyribonuclease VII large subunit, partial [Ensifer sp.]|nr:exodeoxyribonuclease VII large subunit [Ensifer sp.]